MLTYTRKATWISARILGGWGLRPHSNCSCSPPFCTARSGPRGKSFVAVKSPLQCSIPRIWAAACCGVAAVGLPSDGDSITRWTPCAWGKMASAHKTKCFLITATKVFSSCRSLRTIGAQQPHSARYRNQNPMPNARSQFSERGVVNAESISVLAGLAESIFRDVMNLKF